MCVRSNIQIFNLTTGEYHSHGCQAYCCPECGPKKVYRLKKALSKEFKKWKHLCFWTFTINARSFPSPEIHYQVLTESFSRLITYLRRHPKVSNHNFRYIRFNEIHFGVNKHSSTGINTGYVHLHACVDTYINIFLVIKLWRNIVKDMCNKYNISYTFDKLAGCYVKALNNPSHAANYVNKYVSKTVLSIKYNKLWQRFYSKSNSIVLFNNNKNKTADCEYVVLFSTSFSARILIGLKPISASPQLFSWLCDIWGLSHPEMKNLCFRSGLFLGEKAQKNFIHQLAYANSLKPVICGLEDYLISTVGVN